jgi:hypothetical protein
MGVAALLSAAQTFMNQRAVGGRLLVDRKRKQVYVDRTGGV